jgi:cytidylate kinase
VKPLIIAIDGPSGAGKGTVARAIATALGYHHLDTGAMYRAVAVKALDRRLALDDEQAIAALAHHATIDALDGAVTIDGEDVRSRVRNAEVDRAAASVARLPKVRQALVALQRRAGTRGGIVVEGRDIGTVVFPGADVKIYLDASPEERARRRAADPAHGTRGHVQEVATEMGERDRLDSTRSASPLHRAADAQFIDTTGRPIDDVVDQVLALVRARTGG